MLLTCISIAIATFIFIYLWAHLNVFETLFKSHIVFNSEEIKQIVNDVLKEHPEGSTYKPVRKGSKIHDKDEAKILNEEKKELVETRIRLIHQRLYERWPKYIVPPSDIDWENPDSVKEHFFLCKTGGAIGQVMCLHASLSEYILVFGTPLGTTGHSGRYLYHIRDYIISGHHQTYLDGDLHGSSYRPGQVTVLPKGEGVIYKSEPHTYMFEWGHGFPGLLLATIYPILATLFDTWDFYSIYKQYKLYGTQVLKNLIFNRKI